MGKTRTLPHKAKPIGQREPKLTALKMRTNSIEEIPVEETIDKIEEACLRR